MEIVLASLLNNSHVANNYMTLVGKLINFLENCSAILFKLKLLIKK